MGASRELEDPVAVRGLISRVSRANLRMARSYEGSHARLKQVIRKALRGEELVLATIGGSGAVFPALPDLPCFAILITPLVPPPVTGGHGVSTHEIWFSLFGAWFEEFMQPERDERIGYVKVNGAVPGTRAWRPLILRRPSRGLYALSSLSDRQRLL